MDVANLLHSLTVDGLTLRVGAGDSLGVVGDVSRLTLTQQQALRTHKATLLKMLSPPPTCYFPQHGDQFEIDERDAIQFADTADALKPLSEAIEFFSNLADDMRIHNPEALAQTVLEPDAQQSPCLRCGSLFTYLAVIHSGESLRRDCAQCGRFIDFPAWHEREKAGEILAHSVDSSRYNERRTAQVVEHLSSPNESLCIRKENADG